MGLEGCNIPPDDLYQLIVLLAPPAQTVLVYFGFIFEIFWFSGFINTLCLTVAIISFGLVLGGFGILKSLV